MPFRYQETHLSKKSIRLFSALRASVLEKYSKKSAFQDLIAGCIVGLVALPLAMALGIATGLSPQAGLYTAIVAGFVAALCGGSRFQVTGPTAAFVVILAPIVHDHGVGGLLLASFMAGFILIVMALSGFGRLIQFIPHTVTTGFTSGIAVVIAVIQVKDFLGLQFQTNPESFRQRVSEIVHSLATFQGSEAAIGVLTLGVLIFWPKVTKRIPAPFVALSIAAVAAAVAQSLWPSFSVATIGSRFSTVIDGVTVWGIPQQLPQFEWPWNLLGVDGTRLGLSLGIVEDLLPAAFAIAMLGAIESLLSAVIADGLTKTKHDSDTELFAQGLGNIFSPLFGGFAATGAIARTATNIRFGAQSPLAAIFHAVFILFSILLFAPWLSYLPMSSLAALLLMVAWNISERHQFVHIVKVAPRSDIAVLLTCFGLTVMVDMIAGVAVGIGLASLLFIRRMSEMTKGQARSTQEHSRIQRKVPSDILLYEISGAMFFGAAQKAVEAIATSGSKAKIVIVDLENVLTMDTTGLVALESMVDTLRRQHRKIVLSGAHDESLDLIHRSPILRETSDLRWTHNLNDAITTGEKLLETKHS
jgi:SulP family sulfate permease